MGSRAHQGVPRVIWTYWNSSDLPPLVQECVATWSYWNHGYEVRVITPANVRRYVGVLPSWAHRSPQMEADYVRACVVSKHGGVWSDATVFCTGPFPYQDEMNTGKWEFFGYFHPRSRTSREPALENWWFAATAGSRFMREWADAFLATANPQDRVNFYHAQGVNLGGISNRVYFLQHMSAQYVLQKVVSPEYIRDKMFLRPSGDANGPRWFRDTGAKDGKEGLGLLGAFLEQREDGEICTAPTLHKLVNTDRKVLQKLRGGVQALIDLFKPAGKSCFGSASARARFERGEVAIVLASFALASLVVLACVSRLK